MRNKPAPKRTIPAAAPSPSPQPRRAAWGVVFFVALSVALCLLSLFQWMELLVVAGGGSAVCSVSANVDCATVWTSSFSTAMHAALGMPVAAMGLVYGLTCLSLGLVMAFFALVGRLQGAPLAAAKLAGAVGVLACVVLVIASTLARALCLTCLGTYVLTVALAGVAWQMLPGVEAWKHERLKAALLAVGVALGFYLLLLYPGLRTVHGTSALELHKMPVPVPSARMEQPSKAPRRPESPLQEFFAALSSAQKQALKDEVIRYRARSVPSKALSYSPRYVAGPSQAPVRITEFADILCSHCAELEHTLKKVRELSSPGSFSVEPRWYPLASECNPQMGRPDPTGARCAGAKALVCLEGQGGYWKVREVLFAQQEKLTEKQVIEVASEQMPEGDLRRCMESKETRAKLQADVAYASAYQIQGTPLVLVNGKEASSMGPFLFLVVATGGNLDAPEVVDFLAQP